MRLVNQASNTSIEWEALDKPIVDNVTLWHESFSAVSSLNYEGWLTKGPEGWKIKRWHDFPDSAVPE